MKALRSVGAALAAVYPLALIGLALPTARAGGRLYVTKERKQQTPRA